MEELAMNQTNHRECFGTIFPDVLHVPNDLKQRGKVFSLLSEPACGIIRRRPEMTANTEQWDACHKCPEFENCYQFSMAKLLLASVVLAE